MMIATKGLSLRLWEDSKGWHVEARRGRILACEHFTSLDEALWTIESLVGRKLAAGVH